MSINLLKTSLTGRRLEKLYSSFNRLRLVSFFFFLLVFDFSNISIYGEIVVENIYPRLIRLSRSPFIYTYLHFILITFIFSLYPGLLKREDDEMVTLYSQIKNTANTRRSVFKTSLRVYIYV